MFRRLLAASLAIAGVAVFVVPSGAQEETPVAEGVGWKHIECSVSHFGKTDPIVFPGQPDTSHEHTFFGNRSTDENTTNESLADYLTTCVGDDEVSTHLIPRDRSAYWIPSLYRTSQTPPLRAKTLGATVIYSIGQRARNLEVFPPGFRMIAGTSSGAPARDPASRRLIWRWYCGATTVTPGTVDVLPECSTPDLRFDLVFPDCWDGTSVDSGNHRSHMAYAAVVGDRYACPGSHPVAVPTLTMRVGYESKGGPGVQLVKGSGANRTFGGPSVSHGDFMNGWVQAHLEHIVEVCLNADEYCGGTSDPVPDHAGNEV